MLEGQLVNLRPVEPTDLERNYTWMNDEEVTYFLELRYPISRSDEEQWLQRRATSNFAQGLSLAIETREGVHIGNIGLHDPSPENRRAALGIVIGEKSYWSNGYGSDAVRTLLRFAFEQMNLNRVFLHVFEYKERAIACYRKCGFQEEGRLRGHFYKHGRYWDTVVMGILREEYEALEGRPA